jgi:spore germination cell wall hydrolase CwlJ-like protein
MSFVSGILLAATLSAIPAADMEYVVKTACAEARGLERREMEAVAHVIINRYESGRYRSMRDVVLEPGQFNVWRGGHIRGCGSETEKARKAVENAVAEAEAGIDPTFGATHFHNHSVRPRWAKRAKSRIVIGKHVFYRI